MKPSQAHFAQLAFQADRKILDLPEEDHYRLDLPAKGKLKVKVLQWQGPTLTENLMRFVVAASLIFLFLFSITNARSYGKIFAASMQQIFISSDAMGQSILESTEGTVTPTEENGFLPLDLTPTSFENRISIPVIEVNAPIVEPELGVEALIGSDWNQLEDQIHKALEQGVVHYPGTALPGQEGNAFFTGHSSNVFWEPSPYNSVFALLPRLQIGDDVYITYNQTEYHYRVVSKEEVSPKNVEVLAQGTDKVLTLMTCTPVGTVLRRLVVRAELIE